MRSLLFFFHTQEILHKHKKIFIFRFTAKKNYFEKCVDTSHVRCIITSLDKNGRNNYVHRNPF